MKAIKRHKVVAQLTDHQHLLNEQLAIMLSPSNNKSFTCEEYHRVMVELQQTGLPWKHVYSLAHAQVKTLFGCRLRKMITDQFAQNHRLHEALLQGRMPHKIKPLRN